MIFEQVLWILIKSPDLFSGWDRQLNGFNQVETGFRGTGGCRCCLREAKISDNFEIWTNSSHNLDKYILEIFPLDGFTLD